MSDKLERFKNALSDQIVNLMAYDRREDEDLSIQDIKELLRSKTLTLSIAEEFFRESMGAAICGATIADDITEFVKDKKTVELTESKFESMQRIIKGKI